MRGGWAARFQRSSARTRARSSACPSPSSTRSGEPWGSRLTSISSIGAVRRTAIRTTARRPPLG